MGLTLIELMVVVVILGIMMAVGIPMYRTTTQRAYYRAARDILQVIYSGERAYYFKAGFYKGGLQAGGGTAWREIFMDDPNADAARLTYRVDCVPDCPTGFVAQANRISGPCAGRQQTINQLRVFGGNWPEDQGC